MPKKMSLEEYRKSPKSRQTEADIQATICQYLDLKSIPYTVTDASHPVRKTGQGTYVTAKRKVSTPGWPDITAVIPQKWVADPLRLVKYVTAYPFFVEVKRPGGKVSAAQKACINRLSRAGAIVLVAYSVDDVIETLKPYL